MPIRTFNPISGPFDHIPPRHPGTIIVAFDNRSAVEVDSARVSFRERILELATARAIAAVVVLTVSLLWVLGTTGFVLAILASLGLAVYLVVDRRSPLATFFIGPIPAFYLVDVSPRTITDERRVQLADTGIYANVQIEYTATVLSATEVVQMGITDVRDYLSRRFYIDIAGFAAEGTLKDKIASLRDKLRNYAQSVPSDKVIKVERATFEVGVEGSVAVELARLSEAELQKQGLGVQQDLQRLERQYYEEIMINDNAFIAEMMRPGADKATLQTALRSRLDTAAASFDQKLTLIKMALDTGVLEQHQIRRDYPDFFRHITTAMTELVDQRPSGGDEPRRLTTAGPEKTGRGPQREQGPKEGA